MFRSLMRFLNSLKIPVIAVLRDSQNYIRAAESGVGLHEMKGARFRVDQAHWTSLDRLDRTRRGARWRDALGGTGNRGQRLRRPGR